MAAWRLVKREWILCEDDPAWTSAIAKAKYKRQFPRLSIHQLAAYMLGRGALGFGENVSAEDLAVIPERKRRYAQAYAWSFYGRRHPYLTPRIPTDGRMSVEDAKGIEPLTKRVTPHTRNTVRLSWLLGKPATGGCLGDEPRARGYRGNPPSSHRLDVNQLNGVVLASNANIAKV